MSQPRIPFVSVVIPVYNDADRLACCLSALELQTYPAERFEIVIIDNGSKNLPEIETPGTVSIRLVVESTPGSYAARNRGINEAAGEIIAFTDSDCIPEPEWLEEGVAFLVSHEHLGAAIGAVELFVPTGPFNRAAVDFDTLFAFKHGLPKPARHTVTANWFSYRSTLIDAGGFDANLRSNGDSAMGRKLESRGLTVTHLTGAVVLHPARTSAAEIVAKSRRLVGGTYELAKRHRLPALGVLSYLTRRFYWDFRQVMAWRTVAVERRRTVAAILVRCYVAKVAELVRLKWGGEARRA